MDEDGIDKLPSVLGKTDSICSSGVGLTHLKYFNSAI